jgi:hypothetical protein
MMNKYEFEVNGVVHQIEAPNHQWPTPGPVYNYPSYYPPPPPVRYRMSRQDRKVLFHRQWGLSMMRRVISLVLMAWVVTILGCGAAHANTADEWFENGLKVFNLYDPATFASDIVIAHHACAILDAGDFLHQPPDGARQVVHQAAAYVHSQRPSIDEQLSEKFVTNAAIQAYCPRYGLWPLEPPERWDP